MAGVGDEAYKENETKQANEELLRLEGITKSFGGVPVIRGLSLTVREGEFVTLLGASGCGKTTTIRIIAGLEYPDAGRVWLDGRDVTHTEPNRRSVNTVFQNYALFPHMNVEANIAYSLKIKRRPKAEIRQTVARALETVRLEGFEKRMPHELSGGQRQRVAIARAVVNNPKVLLLDEPLGALDLQLRRQMQIELKRLQKQLNIAFIYITHDQEEALNMSDRIAVMRDGAFEQIGSAPDVYDRPATGYVARFVGNANVLNGYAPDGLPARGVSIAVRSENIIFAPYYNVAGAGVNAGTDVNAVAGVNAADASVNADAGVNANAGVSAGASVSRSTTNISVASGAVPADPVAETDGSASSADMPDGFLGDIAARITDKSFTGGLLRISAKTEGGAEIVASRHGIDSALYIGQPVKVAWRPANAAIVDTSGDGAADAVREAAS